MSRGRAIGFRQPRPSADFATAMMEILDNRSPGTGEDTAALATRLATLEARSARLRELFLLENEQARAGLATVQANIAATLKLNQEVAGAFHGIRDDASRLAEQARGIHEDSHRANGTAGNSLGGG